MRNLFRLLFVGAVFFVYWKFENTTFAQGSFVVAVAGLLVEHWVTEQFLRRTPRRRQAVPPVPGGRPEAGRGAGTPGVVGDTVTAVLVALALAVMADAFFFTTWLELPDASGASGSEGLAAAIKGVASVLALVVAFLAPVVVGVFVYICCTELLDSRSTEQGTSGGCVSLLPAAAAVFVFYGHFYVAYRFYESIGALRPR
ncbi:hypothetical protein [Streptomyces sp. NBC_00670]|jgi:hypothetical protein|uniref:hypothetical protein n=1 Tax=Streptomyces sp. NBC_00670 TaxID=2975804 RepID=UPI002E2FC964|nr:hypothetical protein [Streptomyces sp. NBC_00670]